MKYRFFTIPVQASDAAATALNQFLSEQRILAVEREFIADGCSSAWAFCIGYDEAGRNPPAAKTGKVDYKEVLSAENFAVFAKLRYMDDMVWFCDDRERIKATLGMVERYLRETLKLEIKQPVNIGPSRHGLVFCGHRILPGAIRLTRRRKKRYSQLRRTYEQACLRGEIGAVALQAAYASVLAATVHANAVAWRREQLRRAPLEGALNEL